MKYSVVDLFSGAGGLSLGFIETGRYAIKVAIENNKDAQKTYARNHPNVELLRDVCQADYATITKSYGPIDVVIGGPPCQGFSNVNRQKNHAICLNNMLIKEYVRAIIELRPKAFVLENVSMLKSSVHRFYLCNSDENVIEKYSIPVKSDDVLLLENEYLFTSCTDILNDKFQIERYLWSPDDYHLINIIYKTINNEQKLKEKINRHKAKLLSVASKLAEVDAGIDFVLLLEQQVGRSFLEYYKEASGSLSHLVRSLHQPIAVQRMFLKAKELIDNDILVEEYKCENGVVAKVYSYSVFDYIKKVLNSNAYNYKLDAGVLNAADFGAPQKRMRFVLIGIQDHLSDKLFLPKGSYTPDNHPTVREAIADLESIDPFFEVLDDSHGIKLKKHCNEISSLGRKLRNSKVLFNHIVTKTTFHVMRRFKSLEPGENFHDLDHRMKEDTYTDASRTQNTIYLRLDYNKPSGTVVNVRKSMWIHPIKNRAISIREAARLQTFPDSFVFEGVKDSQYQQVGNAVPPILAEAIAKRLLTILG